MIDLSRVGLTDHVVGSNEAEPSGQSLVQRIDLAPLAQQFEE